MLVIILLVGSTVFLLAYIVYGGFLAKRYQLDDSRPTPSHVDYDGIDRVPTNKAVLLGHHFSSIAGAAPVLGPILAAGAFGWLPVLLWVLLGSVFIGGVHDMSALIASIRHKARSIAEIAKQYMSPLAYRLMLVFIWLSLVYVLTVFTDLTAVTFIEDGSVATSSILFILLAIGFGMSIYRFKLSIRRASLIFVPLVFIAIWFGYKMPISAETVPAIILNDPAKTWGMVLIVYCFVASTTPVWILLQPRDYLASFLLYASVLGGFAGILLGGLPIRFPAITSWSDPHLGILFPMLFINVACGACSGFHSLVASGTTSKQIDKESDAKPIGYGAMLMEGLVAVIALSTVAMLARDDELVGKAPLVIYGTGMSRFLSVFGIPEKLGFSFGLLALSAFILTTLDTATRLGRYIFEEFFQLKDVRLRYLSTIATLTLPAVFILITLKDTQGNPIPAWKAIWPVFGATNQLLAGLVLLVVAVWLKKTGRRMAFVLGPMIFMNIMTLTALVMLLKQYKLSAVGVIAGILLVLASVLVVEAYKTVKRLAVS
jgi:carbon starvation protein